MSLELLVKELARDIPGCLAAGVVDVPTGTVVTVKAAEREFKERFELIASAASSVFAAAPREVMEGTVGPIAGAHSGAEFKEVTLMGNGQLQVYCRAESNPDLALVIVCKSSRNLGMVLAKAHLQLATLNVQAG